MKSYVDPSFVRAFRRLPRKIQLLTRAKYRLFKVEPFHPSLQFKQVSATDPIYSVRINRNYRALGLLEGDRIDWFWIGSHDEYDQLPSSH
jgi:plasmid maintenance system killer protein